MVPRMDLSKLKGLEAAKELVQDGKFIFAIKLLERYNPELTRADAKAAVDSFGLTTQPKAKAKKTPN